MISARRVSSSVMPLGHRKGTVSQLQDPAEGLPQKAVKRQYNDGRQKLGGENHTRGGSLPGNGTGKAYAAMMPTGSVIAMVKREIMVLSTSIAPTSNLSERSTGSFLTSAQK